MSKRDCDHNFYKVSGDDVFTLVCAFCKKQFDLKHARHCLVFKPEGLCRLLQRVEAKMTADIIVGAYDNEN
jgi:hypothetical protein